MRTSKPIATISYNSQPFLEMKLKELVASHKICDWVYINHRPEEDEKKGHTHVWLKPNTLLDTMDLQDFFKELDPLHPLKPLGVIDFKPSQVDDFILYGEHFEPYLASKGETREFHYTKDDFCFADEDSFDDLYHHAHFGSDWAHRFQILRQLTDNAVNPSELILNGTLPLNMASNLNALLYMRSHSGLDRNGRKNHEIQS